MIKVPAVTAITVIVICTISSAVVGLVCIKVYKVGPIGVSVSWYCYFRVSGRITIHIVSIDLNHSL